MQDLQNKVAIVTGAGSGIGFATAVQMARAGVHLVAGSRSEKKLSALVREIEEGPGQCHVLAGDVRSADYHECLVKMAVSEYGGLDIAFNNAGILGELKDISQLRLEEWQEVLTTNLTAAFLAASHQVPALEARGGGALIFTSSFVGYTASFPGMSAYAASKAGIIGLVKTLAVELASKNIRVNALLPGGTETPMAAAFANTPEMVEFINHIHAMGRQATPEEIAQSVLYLASDMAAFTTGTALLADGGVSIKRG